MLRRKKNSYFERREGDPEPIKVSVRKRAQFNEVDAMGVVWHGNYMKYFEEAAAELGRKTGLGYKAYYEAKIQAPIVQLHTDYHKPLFLDEEFTVEASFVWSEGARLHTEFAIRREDGVIAASGYTVQMFMDALTKEPVLVTPQLLESCRKRWRAGEFN